MKTYDFRCNKDLLKSFVGKKFTMYKHAEFIFSNSVTGILGIQIDEKTYQLTNEYETVDFLGLDNEATVFRIKESNWKEITEQINNDVLEYKLDENISKITLVNDHTILKTKNDVEYDMWETKAIIFYMNNHEISFVKQDCWFSQEIEIFRGYDLLEKVGDGQGIIDDFEDSDDKSISVARSFVTIQ